MLKNSLEDEIKFAACETGPPDVIVNGAYLGKLEYYEFDIPGLKGTSHDECLKKEQNSQQSILENMINTIEKTKQVCNDRAESMKSIQQRNDTKRLEDTNVRENSKEEDVSIPSMMTVNEYQANQTALPMMKSQHLS